MTETIKNMKHKIMDMIYTIQNEEAESWGHEYNSNEFRPFTPNQFKEKELKTLLPELKSFILKLNEQEQELLINSSEFQQLLALFNTIPRIDSDLAANYAIVIIDEHFFLLKDKFFIDSVKRTYSNKVGYICKDTVDIYDYINLLGSTKFSYDIGTDDFSYYIGNENSNDNIRKSVIQIGLTKYDYKTVILTYNDETSEVSINYDGNTFAIEKHKPYIITINKNCYCSRLKLTSKGFEIIDTPLENIDKNYIVTSMYPDISTFDCEAISYSIDKSIVSCKSFKEIWYYVMNKYYDCEYKHQQNKCYAFPLESSYCIADDDSMPF